MTAANMIDQPTGVPQSRLNVAPLGERGRKPAVRYVLVESPVGWILVAGTERGVAAVRLGDDPSSLEAGIRTEFPGARHAADADEVGAWAREIVRHLEGETHRVDVPLDLSATAFQRRVWDALRSIPRGETRSYHEIASAVGAPGAARAVARACATNPVALVVPCHRVIRGDGELAGYRWGVARKGALLERERRQAELAEADVLRAILPSATTMQPATRDPSLGRLIAGRYELLRRLGSGGMGVVYQAHDRVLGEAVALKLLHPDAVAADPEELARVLEEVRLTRRVTHRNVVRTHDVGVSGDDRFLVMEYVDGASLAQVLAARGRLPVAAVLVLGMQLARALETVHARGVLHRDVKPENILLATDGQAKLADFGIAALREAAPTLGPGSARSGTPPYMAPEVLLGESADVRADVFAAAAVLHESLTGQRPFAGATPSAIAASMLRGDPLPVAREPGVPPALVALLSAALAADPGKRPGSAGEFHDELAALAA